MIGIYCIQNKTTGKRYVGKSINIQQRFWQHKYELTKGENKKHFNRYLKSAVQKYGIDDFIFSVLEVFEVIDEEKLKEREFYWMLYYKTTDPEFGYNLRMDSSTKMICHDDTKRLISESVKGVNNPNYGNKWTEEQKKYMSEKKKSLNYRHSEEWKNAQSIRSSEQWKDEVKKRSMAQKIKELKKKYNFEQYNSSGVLLRVWESVEQIISENPEYKWQNIYAVCNGYKPSYRGFKWKKVLR